MGLNPRTVSAVNREAQKAGAEVSTTAPAEAEFDVDAVLARYAPKESFDIWFPDGRKVVCKPFRRVSERKAWEKAAAKWYASLPAKGTAQWSIHPFKDHLPQDATEAMMAHLLHTVSQEPKIPLDAACRILTAPDLMIHLNRQIDEGLESCYVHAMRAVEELEGKGSSATNDTESG